MMKVLVFTIRVGTEGNLNQTERPYEVGNLTSSSL